MVPKKKTPFVPNLSDQIHEDGGTKAHRLGFFGTLPACSRLRNVIKRVSKQWGYQSISIYIYSTTRLYLYLSIQYLYLYLPIYTVSISMPVHVLQELAAML